MRDLFVVGLVLAIFVMPLTIMLTFSTSGMNVLAYLLGALVIDLLRANIPRFEKMRGKQP